MVFNFIICWLGWGIPMGLLCSLILGSLRKGMLFGIVGGMVFAVGIVLFQGILASRKDKLRERYGIAGMVLRDGAANHMVGKEAVGGWIFLMEDRFCFVSHAFNVTTGAWTVPYSAIADVTKGKMLRSIAVHTKGGNTEEFVVDNCSDWIRFLKGKCGM